MEDRLKVLKSFLPPEVSERLKVKRFSQGELVLTSLEGSMFFIQKGAIGAISHYENREYFLPYRLKPGEVAGLGKGLFFKSNWWNFIATTDAEVIIFSKDIVENYLLNNFTAYKYLVEEAFRLTEELVRSLHIQVQGGARALFAYALVEYSIDNEFHYLKYDYIAKALNISRARLYKIEKEFVEKGLILKGHKKIIILKKAELRDYYKDFIFME